MVLYAEETVKRSLDDGVHTTCLPYSCVSTDDKYARWLGLCFHQITDIIYSAFIGMRYD